MFNFCSINTDSSILQLALRMTSYPVCDVKVIRTYTSRFVLSLSIKLSLNCYVATLYTALLN